MEVVPRLLPHPLKPGGKVELEGVPDRPVIAAQWSPGDSSGCADCLFYTFYPEYNTWVSIIVYDSAGCPAVDSFLVAVEPNVYAPNVIRPASLLGNDRFTLFSREDLRIQRLTVFDRWGEQVFDNQDFFTNNPDDGWNGSFRGKWALPGCTCLKRR